MVSPIFDGSVTINKISKQGAPQGLDTGVLCFFWPLPKLLDSHNHRDSTSCSAIFRYVRYLGKLIFDLTDQQQTLRTTAAWSWLPLPSLLWSGLRSNQFRLRRSRYIWYLPELRGVNMWLITMRCRWSWEFSPPAGWMEATTLPSTL